MIKFSKKETIIFVVFVLIITISLIGVNLFNKIEKSKQGDKKVEDSSQNVIPLESQEVVEIAENFLKQQKFFDEYDLDSARIENYSQFWSVWFDKKDLSQKPNKGLIQIKKENREAYWVELY